MAAVHADAAVFGYTAFSQEASAPQFQKKEISEIERKSAFKPQELCPCSKDDFIIFAEFSEVTGPIPLLTIPSNLEDNEEMDINNLIMKIMSVDYQANPCGQFSFCQDVQVLQADVVPGIHAYVHYCTLHDLKARGFVRPLCLAYMSADHKKLHHLFPVLREQFLETTEILKYNNQQWFMDEISKVLANLKGIQNRYFYWKKKEEDGLSLTDDEQKLMAQTKIDQLVHQYTEYKHMLHTVEPLLVNQEMKDLLNDWKCGFVSSEGTNNPIELYLAKLRHEILNKSGRDSLRSVVALSPWGLAATMWQLLSILRKHSHCRLEQMLSMFPPSLPLPSKVESEEHAVESALSDTEYLQLITRVIQPVDSLGDKNLHDRTRSQDCLTQDSLDYLEASWLTSGNEASSSYHSVPESITELLALERPVPVPHWSDVSSTSSHSNESFLDISETDSWAEEPDGEVHTWVSCIWNCDKIPNRHLAGQKLLKFFQMFPKAAHHILYSLLIGRTVVLAGSDQMEHKVGNMINALIALVPVSSSHTLKILRWHRGILVSSHIASYQLIGMCIPERLSVMDMISPRDKNMVTILHVDSKQLFGPAYSGHLLSSLETVPLHMPSDQTLLLYLQSVAAALHQKLFVYHVACANQMDLDLHGCDGEIVKYLSRIQITVPND